MKKIFLLFATVCAILSCDPIHEDISNGGHISADELKSMSSVTVDKDANGNNGNVITCTTSAPVNAMWSIGGKDLVGNYAWKKMKVGEHTVTLTGLCADGTVVTTDFTVNCQTITDPLQKYYIYGEDPTVQPPFKPGAWNAACMRFSDNEGKFVDINGNEGFLPYLSDDVYWGFKTLIFDISDATDDCAGRIMNGWWSARYDGDKDVHWTNGLWELPLTEAIAKDCARGNGGSGKDLDIMVTSGSMQINAIYYEE
ncbi:MAG: hypothetical protein J5502_00315 [Prevotella sp.]|nr:hypothetical protein [Prevotella sp.]